MIKRAIYVALTCLLLINIDLVHYGLKQLYGQLNIVLKALPLEQVLSDKSIDHKQKESIKNVQEIKRFAFDQLGLKKVDNYNTYFNQNNKPILWVLTASEPYKLAEYNWHFPILGATSYKGYFDRSLGIKEAERLKNLGYDVDLSPTSAWSTLGWFKDPILSGMLNRSEGQLAELIIHELTHSTIFIENDITYNENLATFIGETGAKCFLINKYGSNSKEYIEYIENQHDDSIFGAAMVAQAKALDSLYFSIKYLKSRIEKEQEKRFFFKTTKLKIKSLKLKHPQRYQRFFEATTELNNCDFLAYLRYREKQSQFASANNQDLKGLYNWIRAIKEEIK